MRTPQANPVTKEALLETAQGLMLSKGYSATSIDDICKAANLTKGGFFHYFSSKEDLGKAVLERYTLSMFQLARNASFSKKSDPLQRVYGYIDFMIELAKDPARRSGCLLGNFAQVLSDTHPEIRSQCETYFNKWVDMLKHELDQVKTAHRIKHAIDTRGIADHFVALFEGSLMLAKTRQDLDVVANNLHHFKTYLKNIFDK